jgi:hypothetical protein
VARLKTPRSPRKHCLVTLGTAQIPPRQGILFPRPGPDLLRLPLAHQINLFLYSFYEETSGNAQAPPNPTVATTVARGRPVSASVSSLPCINFPIRLTGVIRGLSTLHHCPVHARDHAQNRMITP